jgi:hypothetical protein
MRLDLKFRDFTYFFRVNEGLIYLKFTSTGWDERFQGTR